MILRSEAFSEGDYIPKKYTCDGKNISPPLIWDKVPLNTKSFALIVDDPDAPMGTWVHWLICNIDPSTRFIAENSIPKDAKQIVNDFSKLNYGGPCPPSGVHRYYFKLYALNVDSLDKVSDKNFYEQVKKHAISQASLMGKYKREK